MQVAALKRPLGVTSFRLPREGMRRDCCGDALSIRASSGRFALADGATEAFDSGRWAKLLARAWTTTPVVTGGEDVADALGRLGRALHRSWTRRPLAWFAEEKARQGSFATLLGFQLCGTTGWYAVAIGDSCLFQERAGELRVAFPLADPAEFGQRPALVPSLPQRHRSWARAVRVATGSVTPGDVFWLMSDAIACWYLGTWAHRGTARGELHQAMQAPDDSPLSRLVSRERRARRLRDDDVAVLRIEVGEAPSR
jgi:hypothetical protein